MEEREIIKARCDSDGFVIREWRTNEDDETEAVVGRFVVIEDDEDMGLYEGDEGELVVSVVGAEEYNNQRAHFGLLVDDTDCPIEVRDVFNIEAI